jgi:tRNA threonylcarbamoyladenosine biosynthesis protein TsaB
MLLAIDTATRWLGLALYNGDAIIAELGWQAINTQTVELAPAASGLLRRGGWTAADLTGIGVAIGPGSYTGLRVGLGFAKGLSLGHQIPLIGISTLDIVATATGKLDGQLVAVAEAGRSRVCAGRYRYGRRGWEQAAPPDIYSWEELLAQTSEPATFAGEVSSDARKLIRRTGKGWSVLPAAMGTRRAGQLAALAWVRLKKGRIDDAADLSPVYLRDPSGK